VRETTQAGPSSERRQKGHRKRLRIAEAQRRWLASGKELLGEGIAVLASALAGCGPAAITIQIGHGGYRVADGYAIHSVAHRDRHASEVETENDAGVRLMKLRPAIPKSASLARFSSNHWCSWPGAGINDPASMIFV
jgi:hypothetical protein